MTVRVREANGRDVVIPVPMGFARGVIRCIPQRFLDRAVRTNTGAGQETAQALRAVEKENILEILDIVAQLGREYRGLETVRVESANGERVSVTL